MRRKHEAERKELIDELTKAHVKLSDMEKAGES